MIQPDAYTIIDSFFKLSVDKKIKPDEACDIALKALCSLDFQHLPSRLIGRVLKRLERIDSLNQHQQQKITEIYHKCHKWTSLPLQDLGFDALKQLVHLQYGLNCHWNENLINFFFLAGTAGLHHIQMSVLSLLLKTKDLESSLFQAENSSKKEQELLILLREIKKMGVLTVHEGDGEHTITLKDCSSEQSWELLDKLRHFCPIRRLALEGISKECFSFFLKKISPVYLTIDDPKFKNVKCDGCTSLVSLKAPYARKVICTGCTSLVLLKAPYAREVNCTGCTSLACLKAPEAFLVDCAECTSLKTLTLPKGEIISCRLCSSLMEIKAPGANEFYGSGCHSLKELTLPIADYIDCEDSTSLVTLIAPKAKEVICSNCPSLENLITPIASTVICEGCTKLRALTILADWGVQVDCRGCSSLVSLEVTSSSSINCSDCTALVSIEAPNAKEIKCTNCTSLKTLAPPKATVVDCTNCTELESLFLPEGIHVVHGSCASLVTLSLSKAMVVNCVSHSKLTGLFAPNARMCRLIDCISLETLSLPKAHKVICKGLTSLVGLSCSQARHLCLLESLKISSLYAPRLLLLRCDGLPNLKDFQVHDIVEIQPQEIVASLPLNAQQLACQKLLASYELHQASLVPDGMIPDVPPLNLEAIPPLNDMEWPMLREKLMTLISNIDLDDSQALYYAEDGKIKNGGKTYTKEDLRNGLSQIFENSEEAIQHLLLNTYNDVMNSTHYKAALRNSAFIRLLTTAGEDGIEGVKRDLHLFYRLEQLLSFFDSINFDDPYKANYIHPGRTKNDRGECESPARIKANLIRLFDHVKNRKASLGSPPEASIDKLRLYYQTLEQYLQLLALNLANLTAPEEKASYLIDLGIAAGLCATRWLSDAMEIYTLSSPEQKFLKIPDLIHFEDTQFKLGLIQEFSKKNGVVNVHTYQQYKRLLTRRGVFSYEILERIPDPCETLALTEGMAMVVFCLEYRLSSVLNMVREFLKSLFSTSMHRGRLIEYLKEMKPVGWEGEHGKILEMVRCMEDAKAPRDDVRKALKKHGYPIRPDWSAHVALDSYLIQEELSCGDNTEALRGKVKKWKTELACLSREDQKTYLQKKGVPLGPDDPDFSTEIILTCVNADYIASLFEKDSTGEPTFTLTWKAVCDILEQIQKISKKQTSPPSISGDLKTSSP